jgi:hypothetical protein
MNSAPAASCVGYRTDERPFLFLEWIMAKARQNLTRKACREQAANCKKEAKNVMTPAHRIMLEHIADTWLRIAVDIEERK